MSESRNNYKKTDIKLNLINALRTNYMTREDIRNFLSAEYKRLGKTPADCKNIAEYKVSERTVKRTIDSIKDSYGDQLEEEAGAYKLDLYDFPDTIDDTEIRALEFAIQTPFLKDHIENHRPMYHLYALYVLVDQLLASSLSFP